MGSHISVKTLKEFWPLVALPLFMLSVTYVFGRLSVRFLNQPLYIVPGMVFNNVVAMPLLLMEAISHSDVLLPLLRENESIESALVRAKAYVLLHGIVHNIARFALGPLMLQDSHKSAKTLDIERSTPSEILPTERTALLGESEEPVDNDTFLRKRARLLSVSSIDADETSALLRAYADYEVEEVLDDGSTAVVRLRRGTLSALFGAPEAKSSITSVSAEDMDNDDPLNSSGSASSTPISPLPPAAPPSRWNKILDWIEGFFNPAVSAALLAVIIGVTPPLHYLFYDNVAIASSFTQSIKSIGGLYPALQLFALGSKLTAPLKQPVRKSTIILISIVRFGLAGVISISLVYYMTTYCSSFWPMDPMLNFVLMITPVGPPAITLAAVAEIAGLSPGEVTAVSRTLLYSYIIAPLVAPSVAVALSIAYQIQA